MTASSASSHSDDTRIQHKGARRAVVTVLVAAAVLVAVIYSTRGEAATAPSLGTAQSFAVLAGSGITNTGPTTITGDVGTFPTTTEVGFGSITLNGANHVGDAVTQGAKTDLVTAYNVAAGQLPTTTIPTELGGSVLLPGAYDSAAGTFGITGTLTLNALGDPNAVFVFKMASTLITAAGSSVVLTNGAQACNVFWQVGSSATLGTNSFFTGNILALTSISLTTGANVVGRVLARNGAVTMDTNVITATNCAVIPPFIPTATLVPAAATATSVAAATATVVANVTATSVAGATATAIARGPQPLLPPIPQAQQNQALQGIFTAPRAATPRPGGVVPGVPAVVQPLPPIITPPQTGDAGLN